MKNKLKRVKNVLAIARELSHEKSQSEGCFAMGRHLHPKFGWCLDTPDTPDFDATVCDLCSD